MLYGASFALLLTSVDISRDGFGNKPCKQQFKTNPFSRSKLREAVGSRLLLPFSHKIFVQRNYLPKIAAFCRNCSRLAAFSSSSRFRSSCSIRISSSNFDAFRSCSICTIPNKGGNVNRSARGIYNSFGLRFRAYIFFFLSSFKARTTR